MSIVLKRRPYNINFSGNTIVYELYDADAVVNADVTFEVRIMFSRYQEGAPPAEIAIIPLTPYLGTAKIDIADLLHCQLAYYLPNPNIAGAQVSGLQTGSFFIHYRSITTDSTNTAWNTTEENTLFVVVKGGIHPYAWQDNNFFITYFPQAKPFLTWQQRGRLAGLTEAIWLCWLNTVYSGSDTTLKVNALVTFTDASTAPYSYTIAQPYKQNNVYYLAAGAWQLNLQNLSPTKTIWYWDVYITDSNGTILTEVFRYVNDQRNDYNQLALFYRNSLGGLDTIRLRGSIETTVNLDGSDVEQAAPADWAFTGALPRFDAGTPYREMPLFKADIGYVNKDEQDRLRDAFLNREVYLLKFNRFLPVKLTTRQYRLRSTTDKLFNLPIEFILADGGSYYYTPENVDMGVGQGNLVCDTIIRIGLPTLNTNGSNTTLAFFYSVTGTPEKLQWKIPGYVEDWQDLAFNAHGVISYTVQTGQSITLYMRGVCAGNSPGTTFMQNGSTQTTTGINSTLRNNTVYTFTFTLKRNGGIISQGTLAPNEYAGFPAQTGNGDWDLDLSGVVPASATLRVFNTNFNGIITGQNVHWDNIFTTIFGCTINVY